MAEGFEAAGTLSVFAAIALARVTTATSGLLTATTVADERTIGEPRGRGEAHQTEYLAETHAVDRFLDGGERVAPKGGAVPFTVLRLNRTVRASR